MTVRGAKALSVGAGWDTFWRSAESDAAYSRNGISHPATKIFWNKFFRSTKTEYSRHKIIDIASGNGAVLESAANIYGEKLPHFTCVDFSSSAIEKLQRRFPGIHTIVSDVRRMPLDSARYDVVTSQFGIEYAGLDVVNEVTRLITPGGRLAFLLHHQTGQISQQCKASLDAIERMQRAEFIPRALTMFENGFAACRGADREQYDAAAKQLAPSVHVLEEIMTEHGTNVAGGLLQKLYADVAEVHEHLQQYEPDEVLRWLASLSEEVAAMAERMASMHNAAVDGTAFYRLCDELRREAFTIVRSDAIRESDAKLPLAWALIAVRE